MGGGFLSLAAKGKYYTADYHHLTSVNEPGITPTMQNNVVEEKKAEDKHCHKTGHESRCDPLMSASKPSMRVTMFSRACAGGHCHDDSPAPRRGGKHSRLQSVCFVNCINNTHFLISLETAISTETKSGSEKNRRSGQTASIGGSAGKTLCLQLT